MIIQSLWCLLAIKCVLSIHLYYRIGGGEVYGPFPEEQLQEWVDAGYFSQATNLQISTSPVPETFVLYSSYDPGTSTKYESHLVSRKSGGILKILSRKAGSLVKFNNKKLLGIRKLVMPPMKKDDTTASPSVNNIATVTMESQGSVDLTAPPVPSVTAAEPTSAPGSEWSTDASQPEDEWPSLTGAMQKEEYSSTEDTTKSNTDDSLLRMLKRDPVDASAKSSAYAPKKTDTKRIVEKEKVRTYSVRSLPKADHSLWDAEQDSETGRRSALGEDFFADLKLTDSPSVSEGSKDVTTQVLLRKRAATQLSLVCFEIGRYIMSLLACIIPGPTRTSWQYLTSLAANKEDRIVLVQLGMWLVLSILKWLLYIAAAPSLCNVLTALSTLNSAAAGAQVGIRRMHDTNSAAAAGDIVTTVLRRAPSVQHESHVHAWQKGVQMFQLLRQQLAEEGYERVFRVLSTIKPGSLHGSIHDCVSQVQHIWMSLESQLRTASPAVVTLTLVIAIIVLVDGILMPAVQGHLNNRLIADPSSTAQAMDNDSNNLLDDEEDELLDPVHRTKRAVMPQPLWLPVALDVLKHKVSSGPFVSYLQDVGGYTAHIMVQVWLLLQVLPRVVAALSSLAVDGRSDSGNILVLPMIMLTVGGIVAFYGIGVGGSRSSAVGGLVKGRSLSSVGLDRSSTQRTAYLTSVLSDGALVDWCRRWNLLDYVASSLSQEMAQLGGKLVAGRAAVTTKVSSSKQAGESRWISNVFTMAMLACSIYAWSFCGARLLPAAAKHNIDLARSLTDGIVKTASDNFLLSPLIALPHQLLQRFTYFLLQMDPPAAGLHDIIEAPPLIPQPLCNAVVMCFGVLLVPNALRLGQIASLQKIRALTPSLAPADALKSPQYNILRSAAEALLQAQRAIYPLPALEDAAQQVCTGWTTDGPNRTAGIELSHVSASSQGRIVLKDVTLTLPVGQITVLLSPDIGTPAATSALLRLLHLHSAISLSSNDVQVVTGSMRVQGRDAKEWNAAALSRRMTFLSTDEPNLNIQAGAMVGCLPGTAGARLRQALRAQAASGAHAVIAALPAGPATIVSADNNAGTASSLSTDQWTALHVSRALCNIDVPIVLLDQPTTHMSDAQEALFFAYLREHLRPEQVIVVSSTRTRTAAHADRAVQLSKEGRVLDIVENLQQRLSQGIDTEETSSTIMAKLRGYLDPPSL